MKYVFLHVHFIHDGRCWFYARNDEGKHTLISEILLAEALEDKKEVIQPILDVLQQKFGPLVETLDKIKCDNTELTPEMRKVLNL